VRPSSFIVAQKNIFSRCNGLTQRSAVAVDAVTVNLITVAIALSITKILGYREAFHAMRASTIVVGRSPTVIYDLCAAISQIRPERLRHAASPSSRNDPYNNSRRAMRSWYRCISFNPFPDEQLILDGHRARTSLPF
jgi:hypothetical protein